MREGRNFVRKMIRDRNAQVRVKSDKFRHTVSAWIKTDQDHVAGVLTQWRDSQVYRAGVSGHLLYYTRTGDVRQPPPRPEGPTSVV